MSADEPGSRMPDAPGRTDPGAGDRLHWVDVAKAIAIVLVVVYHVAVTGMTILTPGINRVEGVYSAASTWLLPVRMPLLFLVSGLLSTGALARPWRAVVRPRILNYAWVFVLWTLLYAYPYANAFTPGNVEETTLRALSWTVTLNGAYWYLPLLLLFFVVAKLGRRLGAWMVAVAGLGYLFWWQVGIGDGMEGDADLTVRRFLTFFVWYALGAFARPLVAWWARAPWWLLPPLAAAYIAVALVQYGPQRSPIYQVLIALLSVIGISAMLIVSRLLAQWGPTLRLGSYLAARTLPIYLVHPMALALLIWLTPGFGKQGSLVSLWLVPLLVVALTWLSCFVYDRLSPNVAWLFRLPGGISGRPRAREGAPAAGR